MYSLRRTPVIFLKMKRKYSRLENLSQLATKAGTLPSVNKNFLIHSDFLKTKYSINALWHIRISLWIWIGSYRLKETHKIGIIILIRNNNVVLPKLWARLFWNKIGCNLQLVSNCCTPPPKKRVRFCTFFRAFVHTKWCQMHEPPKNNLGCNAWFLKALQPNCRIILRYALVFDGSLGRP